MECHVTNREREFRSIRHLTRLFPPRYSSTGYPLYSTNRQEPHVASEQTLLLILLFASLIQTYFVHPSVTKSVYY